MNSSWEQLDTDGFVMLPDVFDRNQVSESIEQLNLAFQQSSDSVLRSRGQTYGSRNLLEIEPRIVKLLQNHQIRALVSSVLGSEAGIVRALFFDKPPNRSWSLPWHQDRTIAVKDNQMASSLFSKPTTKAGIPHVEAPKSLLETMLTVRIHLDEMNRENGPLSVIPGSHRGDSDRHPIELSAEAGDVLAMRPLISHASSMSLPESTAHRRIVHFEMAASEELPDQFQWFTFLSID